MKFLAFFALCAVAIQYAMTATVPSTDIYNCEAGATGTRMTSCGMCGSGQIPSTDRLKCYSCPSFCAKEKCSLKSSITNDNDATDCSQCVDHYFLNNAKCSECSTGCKNCTDATTCNSCYSNYVLKNSPKECASCPSNCQTCTWNEQSSASECTACRDRYVINEQKGCTSCGSLCRSCTFSKENGVSCSTCDETAYKDTSTAASTCKTCANSDNGIGCKKCSDATTCTECTSKAYMLVNNRCDPCTGINLACIECNNNKCTKCSKGYYLKSDSCSSCPRNCDECAESDSIVKCTKCKAYYTLVDVKSCDRCPDNCKKCKVSGSSVVCEQCDDAYAINSNNLCSKCPDNCRSCTYMSANSRTECNGTPSSNFCIQNENGKSWAKKSDGTCVACPSNCLKCYFSTSSASAPICYASQCAIGFTFDDTTGNCAACPTGCDYCKKRSSGTKCLKCSKKYAPLLNGNDIDKCFSCSIPNCDYCEVVGTFTQCLRSPCASGMRGSDKKFSFTSKKCDTACPANSGCAAKQVNDENEACYCRSCPSGHAVIEAGPNVGICKSCGTDCNNCGLTSDKQDVECKTCAGNKQWVSVESSGSTAKGCYDCSIALPGCDKLEWTGSVCKCKQGGCIGDQTDGSSPNRHTVLQETAPSTYGLCKMCADEFPNALFCSGDLGTTFTASAPTAVEDCQYQYVEKSPNTKTCISVPVGCSNWNGALLASSNPEVTECQNCAVGFYLDTSACTACPPDCKRCVKPTGQPVVCTACNDATKTGPACEFVTATACPMTVADCPDANRYATAVGTCTLCRGCGNSKAAANPTTANTGNNIGACTAAIPAPAAISDCDQPYEDATPSIKCARCAETHIKNTLETACQQVANCKTGYNFDNTNTANCIVAAANYISVDVTTNTEVPAAAQAGSQCTGYLSLAAPIDAATARCGGCASGYELDTSSATKYDCVACSETFPGCAFKVAHKGTCMCARCNAPGGGSQYFKHPTEPGCFSFSDITDCSKYSLKLKDGNYIGVCLECSGDKLPSGDGLSCIDCSSVTCTSGTKAINSAGTACECTCSSSFLVAAKTSCKTCSAINNCATLALDSSDNCICDACNANHQLKTDKSGCIACQTGGGGATANCKECSLVSPAESAVDKCTKCLDGFALNSAASPNPTCVRCLPNPGCSKCTVDASTGATTNKCTECTSGYKLNNAGVCIRCPQSPAICDECRIDPDDQTKTLCLSFGCSNSGLALTDADFTCESCTISNCKLCVKTILNTFQCLKCNDGHYMNSGGDCLACPADCGFCLDGDTCLPNGCKEGFIRHRGDGTCIACTGEGVARCIYETAISDTLVPKICKSGFKLNSASTPNVCEKCDPNCKSCETNGKDKCDSGQCNSGYFYDSTDQKCFLNRAGCATSTRSNGKTVCQSCDTSKSVLANEDCKACGTGCTGCSFDSATSKVACTSCAGGYFKNNDDCVACPTGCSVCTSATECTSCLATYGLKDKLCAACGVGECQTCEVPSGKTALECKTCSSKFYLNSDDCGECPKFCKECSYNNKYECTKCNDRYAKASDGTCVACPSNCETCTANADKTTRCTKCISDSFSLQTDGTCTTCTEAAFANCARCGPTPAGGKAACMMCVGGFTLQDDNLACLPCSITGCGMCTHGRLCSKCKKGFYSFNFNRECARKCFTCTGDQPNCGYDISSLKNETERIKLTDCGDGDCWAIRTQVGSTVTYERGCRNETCTGSFENENCKTVDGRKECKKCCRGERCNTWLLDGSAGVCGLVASSFVVILFGLLSLLWK